MQFLLRQKRRAMNKMITCVEKYAFTQIKKKKVLKNCQQSNINI